MIDAVFYWCVDFLEYWAAQLGMTYEEINVYLFVVLTPAIIVIQSFLIAALLLRKSK
jgi:hypothetical protein